MVKITTTLILCFICLHLKAEVLQSPEEFIRGAFLQLPSPKKETFWLNKELKARIVSDFDYRVHQLRLRYWGTAERTAWILEEVGKEQPITMGVVVDDGKISSVDILIYRESRGDEVKHGFFTRQFEGVILDMSRNRYQLSERIDGITGATLSVRAVKKVAKLALFLHALTPYGDNGEKE